MPLPIRLFLIWGIFCVLVAGAMAVINEVRGYSTDHWTFKAAAIAIACTFGNAAILLLVALYHLAFVISS